MNPDTPGAAPGYARFLLVVSGVLLASALFHSVVFLTTQSDWHGYVSWRKPIVFALSFAVTDLTIAYVLRHLPPAPRRGWIFAVLFGISSLAEVALITLQQWRNVPSHFNASTPFDLGVVVALGAFFVPLSVSLLGIAIWSWRSLPRESNLFLGLKIGMVILILGQVSGVVALIEGIRLLRENGGDITSLYPAMNAYKLPHAIALHAVQTLAVSGFLADRFIRRPNSGRWLVLGVSSAIVAAVGWLLFGPTP